MAKGDRDGQLSWRCPTCRRKHLLDAYAAAHPHVVLVFSGCPCGGVTHLLDGEVLRHTAPTKKRANKGGR